MDITLILTSALLISQGFFLINNISSTLLFLTCVGSVFATSRIKLL